MIQMIVPPCRKNTICVIVAMSSATIATGLRPRCSARRPPTTSPTRPGSPVVTVRNSAMPGLEKSRTSSRYLFISCDDGALKMLARKPIAASSAKRRPYTPVVSSRSWPRRISVRAATALYRVVSVSARAMRGARRSVSVPATYARRQPLSPMSMRSATTANEKPNPAASASIEAEYARAPSGASSITAMPATIRVVFTKARCSTCAAVKMTSVGATADNAHANAVPTTPMRMARRRPRRSASAVAKSARIAPRRVIASALESVASDAWNESPIGPAS